MGKGILLLITVIVIAAVIWQTLPFYNLQKSPTQTSLTEKISDQTSVKENVYRMIDLGIMIDSGSDEWDMNSITQSYASSRGETDVGATTREECRQWEGNKYVGKGKYRKITCFSPYCSNDGGTLIVENITCVSNNRCIEGSKAYIDCIVHPDPDDFPNWEGPLPKNGGWLHKECVSGSWVEKYQECDKCVPSGCKK